MLILSCVKATKKIKGGFLMFQENEFKAELVRQGFTINSFITAMKNAGTSINAATLYRKMNGSSDFFLNEINVIADVLHLDGAGILRIFFAPKVA